MRSRRTAYSARIAVKDADGAIEVVTGLREGEWVVAGGQPMAEGRAVRPAGVRQRPA